MAAAPLNGFSAETQALIAWVAGAIADRVRIQAGLDSAVADNNENPALVEAAQAAAQAAEAALLPLVAAAEVLIGEDLANGLDFAHFRQVTTTAISAAFAAAAADTAADAALEAATMNQDVDANRVTLWSADLTAANEGIEALQRWATNATAYEIQNQLSCAFGWSAPELYRNPVNALVAPFQIAHAPNAGNGTVAIRGTDGLQYEQFGP